ncbi:hypothetical protein KFL_006430100 [Klebsormidium nitens]|uniref:EamA domain-containing protein n=1 Tax=Klebsormidium nitens TaxID=105231 RepID=A0A1Y1IIE7_KLENI|nr:hypothetical protein KFL_006430100 [Klebsormidium nitens]|eukprot:GAQ90473.1 hypothetical protein KFL_006430100 [Klebsormidium nitens]
MFQGFLAQGLSRTSAGLGSVIIDSQPLTVALLAALLFGETIGPLGALGLATGVLGLCLLEVPEDTLFSLLRFEWLSAPSEVSQSLSSLNPGGLWESGEWWMLLAAQSMAVGTVMVRWVSKYVDPVVATGWHMLLGGIPLLLLSVSAHEPAVSGHFSDLDSHDFLALLYTSVFGCAVSYGVFFYNASRGNLTKLSSLTFLTPMFAAFFGYLYLDETLTQIQLGGAAVTLVGIYLVNFRSLADSLASTKDEL